MDNNLPSLAAEKEIQREDGAVAMAADRETAEIQSALVIAKRFPRNEAESYANIMKAFERPSLALAAVYRFPRGVAEVKGPSVYLARECGRLWKNLRTGMRIVSMGYDHVHVKGFCYDLESNLYFEKEDRFKPLVQRKVFENGTKITKWVVPDERDLRELVNRHGAICERNAILSALPSYIVDEAVAKADAISKKAAAGQLGQNRDETIRVLIQVFDKIQVSVDMLELKLGHQMSLVNEDELVELRQIYKSIMDGQAKREEFFSLPQAPAAVAADKTEQLIDQLGDAQKKAKGGKSV